MLNVQLSDYEKEIVAHARRQCHSRFYSWGHLIGWLGVPIAVATFLPDLKSYRPYLLVIATVFFAEWYFIVSVRIIGRLAENRNLDIDNEGLNDAFLNRKSKPLLSPPPPGFLIISFILTPLMSYINLYRILSPSGRIAGEALAFIVVLGGGIGTIIGVGSYVVFLLTRNMSLANRWLLFGISLLAWAIIFFPVACLFANVGPGSL